MAHAKPDETINPIGPQEHREGPDAKELKRRELIVNMGPQHPSTHGVLRVILELEGETVVNATPVLGYLHRCFEKICESWTYVQIVPFCDRNDYVAAMLDEHAMCLAIERLMDLEVPERAEYIRVIVTELNRIASHLLWLGTFGLDLGAVTPFLYAFRDRELIIDLFQRLTGARLFYSYLRIGGVRNDLPDGFLKELEDFLDYLDRVMGEYDALLTNNPIFVARTRGVGVLRPEDALRSSASGPFLRASGVRWDLRKNRPYSIYNRFDFEVPVGTSGDCYDRYLVRLGEIRQSSRIIYQALRDIPDGPVRADVPKVIKPPEGRGYSRIESPRGELGVYLVSDGSATPYRVYWRAPSFYNLQLLPAISRGYRMADMTAIIGSIDIVLGEIDR
mgnify:CR=1 FL=1